jgi:hypothetical protein
MGPSGSDDFLKKSQNCREPHISYRVIECTRTAGRGMRKPGEYQERAAQCLRLAQSMSDPTNKALLLEMAQTWVRLAEQAREAWATPPRWAILSDIRVSSDQ